MKEKSEKVSDERKYSPMDNEYEIMFKRLMNERNELRKYIIDICELLCMDTNQSILGANCLEFYAVLSSVAKDRISSLQEQLKRKEQEYEELKAKIKYMKEYIKTVENARNELEKQCNICEALTPIDEYKDCKKCWQGKILQKISECEVHND